MPQVDPIHAVRLARIRMALRRATGQAFDVEALLLGAPDAAAAAIEAWRALGAPDLTALLDQWVTAQSPAASANPSGPVPRAQAPAPAAPPPPSAPGPEPEPPAPPTDRRYLRGAR
jgi:hypothetical protein